MPQFIPGLDLNRHFFQQVIKPLLDEHFPGLKYAAGLAGLRLPSVICFTASA